MKVTVVPAQVTTIEDRIMGNLSFSQLMLLLLPVFIGAALYIGLPPVMQSAMYKYFFIGIITLLSVALSIRIKGKITALWIIIILRYSLRPTFYVFNKNVGAWRVDYIALPIKNTPAAVDPSTQYTASLPLSGAETVRAKNLVEHPASNLTFEISKKGTLHVRLNKIED